MDIKNLRERKELLRSRIFKFVDQEVEEFIRDTGVSVRGVEITIEPVGEMGRLPGSEYVIVYVNIHLAEI
jgi:hypothetical protein